MGFKLAASVFSFNNTKQTWKSPLVAIFGSMYSPSGSIQSRQDFRTLSKIIAIGDLFSQKVSAGFNLNFGGKECIIRASHYA